MGIFRRERDIEARLRDERPRAGEDFVRRTADGVPGTAEPHRPPRLRLGVAGAITGLVVTAAVALSGAFSPLDPIGDAFEQAASPNANENANKPKPAQSQYEEKVTICHRAKKGEKGVTITTSQQGAENHLKNHPADSSGPCPS